MEKIFLSVLNMSLTASFVIAAICFARLPLKKAPKIISYALWAVAGFRLVFPFTLESVFSLLPFKSAPIPHDIAMQAVPRINSGITVVDNAISTVLPQATPTASVNPLQIWLAAASYVWFFVAAAMLIYSFISILLLKRRLRSAALIEGNLYEADNLKTPFVIGLFQPNIYIPSELSDEERHYIILHEQTHIRRHDHIVKMFAYLLLCLHWFNPLAWAAFILMGADMEMSCDERVMKELGSNMKNAYSLSLVRVAAGRKILNGSPLAFGEGGMKERIKNVLNFKKPSRVVIIGAVILAALMGVGFAVNKRTEIELPDADSVLSVSMNQYNKYTPVGEVTITDKGEINQMLSALSGAAKTLKSSVNDYPIDDNYLLVRLYLENQMRTLYLYTDGADYIEEPYVGIYRPKKKFKFVYSMYNAYLSGQTMSAPAYEPRKWFDYYLDDQMPWEGSVEITLPGYPDTIFRWTLGAVTAVYPNNERILFQGMPVWSLYTADLTGDGLHELCATVSFGSGAIDTRVVVFDYANDRLYTLSDRMVYDYALSLRDGRLIVTRSEYNGTELASGDLVIINGELTAVGIDRTIPEPESAETLSQDDTKPQIIGTTYSPDNKYFIEAYGVDYDTQVSGLNPVKQFRIVEADSGKVVWNMDGLFLLHSLPPFVWSPDSRYVYVAYAGRIWADVLIVDTMDMSEQALPGITQLAPLFPDTTPDDNRPDPSIIPFSWYNHTLSVSFSWRVKEDVDNEENRIYGEYLYDADTGEFTLREDWE